MPRSGSSLLEQILASHDEVFGAGENTSFAPIAAEVLSVLGTMRIEATSPVLRAAGQRYINAMAQRTGLFAFRAGSLSH